MKLLQMRIVFTVVLLLTAIVVLVAPKPSAGAERFSEACGPAMRITVLAHHRAQRGWDSDKVIKRQTAIDRVRLQRRCVPGGEPEAFVKDQIKRARKQYRKAKAQDELVGVSSTYATFAFGVEDGTGLSPRVVAAWAIAEGGPSYNPLNIGPGHHFGSLSGAIKATVNLIRQPLYSGILRSAKGSDSGQISAIAASSWCPGCAGYESLLRGVYARIGIR